MRVAAQALNIQSLLRSSNRAQVTGIVVAATIVLLAGIGLSGRLHAWRQYQSIAALDAVSPHTRARLRATVAYYSVADDRLILQDRTGAIVASLNGKDYSVAAGQTVEIVAETAPHAVRILSVQIEDASTDGFLPQAKRL